jgi:hypothetical protein
MVFPSCSTVRIFCKSDEKEKLSLGRKEKLN